MKAVPFMWTDGSLVLKFLLSLGTWHESKWDGNENAKGGIPAEGK
jgi:hypothetical protein